MQQIETEAPDATKFRGGSTAPQGFFSFRAENIWQVKAIFILLHFAIKLTIFCIWAKV